jgi:hypothetical protein
MNVEIRRVENGYFIKAAQCIQPNQQLGSYYQPAPKEFVAESLDVAISKLRELLK